MAHAEQTPATLLADPLVSPKELAGYLGVSVGTLANQRSRGEGLPFIRIGGLVRYRLSDVRAAEREHTVQPLVVRFAAPQRPAA